MQNKMLNVALPKGRLGERVYAMFEKAGFECPAIHENNRKHSGRHTLWHYVKLKYAV